MKLTKLKLELAGLLGLISAGCMSTSKLDTRIQEIRQKHNVEVRAENPLSRCYLFGYLPGLLKRIDEDLEKCPDYFKQNLGPVIIEEWFFDNLDVYKEIYPPFIIRGYVNERAREERYPIHIKNRNLLEKILLFAPRDSELFSHEAAHSFTFNVMWDEKVCKRMVKGWEEAGGLPYLPPVIGGVFYFAFGSAFPPILYLRPDSMASFYGCVNPLEDMAETHCYLLRHDNNIEFLKEEDPAFYRKCKAWEDFIHGRELSEDLED